MAAAKDSKLISVCLNGTAGAAAVVEGVERSLVAFKKLKLDVDEKLSADCSGLLAAEPNTAVPPNMDFGASK